MDEIIFYFSKNVRRERRLQDLSQEALASQVGIHQTYLGEIERGTRNPSLSVAVRLSEVLGVGLETLLQCPPEK